MRVLDKGLSVAEIEHLASGLEIDLEIVFRGIEAELLKIVSEPGDVLKKVDEFLGGEQWD